VLAQVLAATSDQTNTLITIQMYKVLLSTASIANIFGSIRSCFICEIADQFVEKTISINKKLEPLGERENL